MTLQEFLNDAKSKVGEIHDTSGCAYQTIVTKRELQLIHSAPETIAKLVEVCEVLLAGLERVLEASHGMNDEDVIARDALAKAEGIAGEE